MAGARARRGPSEMIVLGVGLAGLAVTLLIQLFSSNLLRLGRAELAGLYLCAAAITAAGLILSWRTERRKRRGMRIRDLRAWLALVAPDGPELPRVADVDPYGEIGVTRSLYSRDRIDPYLRRLRVDDDLEAALRRDNFVLLVGRSKAGKSRTAFEAVRRTMPDARLLVPRPGAEALRGLLELDPPLALDQKVPVVVWLDNLERYLSASGGVDLDTLARLATLTDKVVIVGTIRSNLRQSLLGTEGESGRAARLVLDQARSIIVPSDLDEAEAEEAGRLYPQEKFERGIGEQLVAAPALERRYHDGFLSDDIGRVGWALVQAAVDWSRVGMFRSISEPELIELARHYLPPRGMWSNPDAAGIAAGLAWAVAEPHNAPVALLEEEGPQGSGRAFKAFDYIVSYGDEDKSGMAPEPSSVAWDFALEHCDHFEALQVAGVAEFRQQPEVAQRATILAGQSDQPLVASLAGYLAGSWAEMGGDKVAARSAYQRAADLGTPGDLTTAGLAAVNLSQLQREEGDLAAAKQSLRRAIGLCDPVGTPLAGINLGGILAEEGDLEGARWAYLQALHSLDQQGLDSELALNLTRSALGALGPVLHRLGDDVNAESTLRYAIELGGDGGSVTRPFLDLGAVLAAKGDQIAALEAYRRASSSKDITVAAAAHYAVATLLEDTDPAAAETAYRKVVDERPDLGDVVHYSLARLALRNGNTDAAIRAYERAADSGSDVAALASYDLGSLLRDVGRPSDAEAAYRRATTFGDAKIEAKAHVAIGALLRRRGELDGARVEFQRAIDSGYPDAAGPAYFNLGRLLETSGNRTGARTAYERSIESEDTEAAPHAACQLGYLLFDEGKLIEARDTFRIAVDSGNDVALPWGLIGLGDALQSLGDPQAARHVFERAARSTNREVRRAAGRRLNR
jgi:tetratricopeptide (TPR) repeat protein